MSSTLDAGDPCRTWREREGSRAKTWSGYGLRFGRQFGTRGAAGYTRELKTRSQSASPYLKGAKPRRRRRRRRHPRNYNPIDRDKSSRTTHDDDDGRRTTTTCVAGAGPPSSARTQVSVQQGGGGGRGGSWRVVLLALNICLPPRVPSCLCYSSAPRAY